MYKMQEMGRTGEVFWSEEEKIEQMKNVPSQIWCNRKAFAKNFRNSFFMWSKERMKLTIDLLGWTERDGNGIEWH